MNIAEVDIYVLLLFHEHFLLCVSSCSAVDEPVRLLLSGLVMPRVVSVTRLRPRNTSVKLTLIFWDFLPQNYPEGDLHTERVRHHAVHFAHVCI